MTDILVYVVGGVAGAVVGGFFAAWHFTVHEEFRKLHRDSLRREEKYRQLLIDNGMEPGTFNVVSAGRTQRDVVALKRRLAQGRQPVPGVYREDQLDEKPEDQ